MAEHEYGDDVLERAVSSESLGIRLDMNRKFQSINFDTWLMDRLNVKEGEDILDVGCGTGSQSIPFLKRIGKNGSVSALDISTEAISGLVKKANGFPNLHAVISDMDDLENVIEIKFPVKYYDLVQSSYALYYSSHRMQVLDVMREHLKPNGRLAVFTPNTPHGMVEFVRQFMEIPSEIDDCMVFGPKILEPYFRKHFWNVSMFLFHNVVGIPTVVDFLTFYRSTTYYSKNVEDKIGDAVQEKIDSDGRFEFEKNGYLIIGQSQKCEVVGGS